MSWGIKTDRLLTSMKVKTSTHKTIVFLKSESINEFLLVK